MRPEGVGAACGPGPDGRWGRWAAWSGSGGSGTRWPCRLGRELAVAGRVRGGAGGGRGRVAGAVAAVAAGVAVGLLVAAGAGLVLAAAPALAKLRALVELVVTQLPGVGWYDSQKFVALAVVEAVCFGLGVERLLPALPRRPRPAVAGPGRARRRCCCPPWPGVGRSADRGRLPAGLRRGQAAMAADPTPGAVLVLPWYFYQPFAWNGDWVVLDPAQRWFTRRACSATTTWSWSASTPGEDPYGSRLGLPGPRRRAPRPGPAGRRGPLRAGVQGGCWRAWSARRRPSSWPSTGPSWPRPGAGATGRGAPPGPSSRPRGRGRPAGAGRARRGLRRYVPSFPTAPVGILRPRSPRRSRMSGLTLWPWPRWPPVPWSWPSSSRWSWSPARTLLGLDQAPGRLRVALGSIGSAGRSPGRRPKADSNGGLLLGGDRGVRVRRSPRPPPPRTRPPPRAR